MLNTPTKSPPPPPPPPPKPTNVERYRHPHGGRHKLCVSAGQEVAQPADAERRGEEHPHQQRAVAGQPAEALDA